MSLLELTAVELAKEIKAGKTTAVEAMKAVLEQIEKTEETYHCYITIDKEKAMQAAKEAQEKIEAGTLTGPLAGVPVAIKDNLCTKGVVTTCASKILENFVPQYDAEAVVKLQEAGAVMIGKTNMDEFAMGSTTETSAFGITKNPHNEEHVALQKIHATRNTYRVVLQAVRQQRLRQTSVFLHWVLIQVVLSDSLHLTAVLSA